MADIEGKWGKREGWYNVFWGQIWKSWLEGASYSLANHSYVTELTETRTKSSPSYNEEETSRSLHFLPDFIWTVRDFMLELELDDYPITEDRVPGECLEVDSRGIR